MNPQQTAVPAVQSGLPQGLPAVIPVTEAHTYLPMLHQMGTTGSLLPPTISLTNAHTYLPFIQQFGGLQGATQLQSLGNPLQGSQVAQGPLQQKISQMAAQMFGDKEAPAVLQIVQKESGFNPAAANKTSSARGLFQFLGSTSQRYGLGRDASQAPVDAQIQAGLNYIADRYKTPSQALQFHLQNGWY